jgi:hypothetical protein
VDPATYVYDPQPIVIIGPSHWPGPDEGTSTVLTADGSKGARAVVVVNPIGLAAGQFVLIDERSGASWRPTSAGFPGGALVWQGDRVAWNMHWPVQIFHDDNEVSDAQRPNDGVSGTLPAVMAWFSRLDRPTNEIKEIAAVSGSTVTFTTPLHISYPTSHAAQLTRYTATGSASGGSARATNIACNSRWSISPPSRRNSARSSHHTDTRGAFARRQRLHLHSM